MNREARGRVEPTLASGSKQPRRILMVATVAATLRAFLLPHAEAFRRMGWQVDALAAGVTQDQGCVHAFDNVFEAEWSRVLSNVSGSRAMLPRIRGLVQTGHYDIVHVHTPIASVVTRFALRRLRRVLGVKVVYTAHGFHFYRGGPFLRGAAFLAVEKLAGMWTDALVVMNDEDLQAARRFRLVPESALRYMPGVGVDTEKYSPSSVAASDGERLLSTLAIPSSARVFVCIAEFIHRKRQSDLLRAFAKVECSDAFLVLAGDGPLFEAMRRLAEELGIANRVRFLGFCSNVLPLLSVASAVLLVSEQEGLPRSLMEASSLGRPIIATDIRGTSELARDCGLLVRVGEIDQITEKMRWVLDHPSEAIRLGEQGRVKMQATYDLSHVILLHEQLYGSLLV